MAEINTYGDVAQVTSQTVQTAMNATYAEATKLSQSTSSTGGGDVHTAGGSNSFVDLGKVTAKMDELKNQVSMALSIDDASKTIQDTTVRKQSS